MLAVRDEMGESCRGDDGFTLVEVLVALVILGVIMTALAPAFYGLMRTSANSRQRSVADGLAVTAEEQIRSYPYWEVGYSSGHNPGGCSAGTPVTVTSSPMDETQSAQSTVSGVTYSVLSCVYWQDASDQKSTDAYKQSVVQVTWGPSSHPYSYTLTSALYPGAQGSYQGGEQNFPPGQNDDSTGAGPPPAPVANSVTPVSNSTALQVDWQPVTYSAPVEYTIEFWAVLPGTTGCIRPGSDVSTVSDISTVSVGNGASDGGTGVVSQVTSGVSASTYYCVDVFAQSGTQMGQPSTAIGPVETGSGSQVTGCTLSIAASPTSPVVDKNGVPVGWSSFTVTVGETPANCSTVPLGVSYGLNGSNGKPSGTLTQLFMSPSGGGQVGSASQASWSAATYGFVLYSNGAATAYQANVTPCQENGNSGHC